MPLTPAEIADRIKQMRQAEGDKLYRLSYANKTILTAATLRELLTLRFADLAEGAILLAEAGHIVPGLTLARAALETMALLCRIDQLAIRYLNDSGEEKPFTEFVEKTLFAGKLEEWEGSAPTNIVTIVQHIGKSVPAIARLYNVLSEYAHPNYHGLMGSYSKPDPVEDAVLIGRDQRDRPIEHVLAALAVCIPMLEASYNSLAQSLSTLNSQIKDAKPKAP